MRKWISVLLVGFLVLLPLQISQAATPKPGGTCSKLNFKQTYLTKEYTCVKSGKKLIWDKGFAVTNKMTSASATPTATKVDTSLELSKYEAVKMKAYLNIRAMADSGSAENIDFHFHISDSFPRSLRELYLEQYKYAGKLYGTFFKKPEIVNIYMYTEKDAQTIQDDPNLNFNFSDFSPWFKDWKLGINREHNIGLASCYLERNGVWQGFAGSAVYSGSTPTSLRPYSIQVQQHEFFHVVQDYYMQTGRGTKFNDQISYDLLFPPTFREGSANTISFALASNSFSDYLSLYHNFIAGKKAQISMPIFGGIKSEKSVIDSLISIESITDNPQAHEASYALGQLLYEYVISQYGFDAFRKIIENQIIVDNFDQNIQKSLGISKLDLYRQAAPHIFRAFSTN